MNTTEETLQNFKKRGMIDDYNIVTHDSYVDDITTIKTVLTTFKDKVPTMASGYASGRTILAAHVADESLANALKRH